MTHEGLHTLSPTRIVIAIPTYDRADALRTTLYALGPQLSDRVSVLIVDDASPTPAASVVATLPQEWASRITCARNEVRVGLAANMLRCFELCGFEWMWLLGDDDFVLPDAVQTLLSAVGDHGDAVYINFASNLHNRAASAEVVGLEDLLDHYDSHANINFMSTGAYRLAAVKKHLRYGHLFSYSVSPHLALILTAVSEGGKAVFATQSVALRRPPRDCGWSYVELALRVMVLLELPCFNDASRRRFAAAILAAGRIHGRITEELLERGVKSHDPAAARYLYDHLCYRYFYYDRSIRMRVRLWVGRWLFAAPRVSLKLIRHARHRLRRADVLFPFGSEHRI